MRDFFKALTVARYTFIEIYKSKIMINILLLGAALFIVSFVAAEFSFGVPARVALDFGLGSLSLAAVGMAIFIGVSLVSKEIENRTVYMVLSRPIGRSSFLLGKIFGMSGILFLNTLILGILSIVLFVFLGGDLSPLIFWALFFAFIESVLILLVVILLSLVTNVTMSVVYSLTIYVIGHGISEALNLRYVSSRGWLKVIIEVYSWVFPNFSKINIKDFILYKQNLPGSFLFGATAYGILYIFLLMLICSMIFSRKNLD